jgi:hypothetical protein
VHLLYDLLLIGKVLSCAAAAADWLKYKSGIGRLIRTSFLFAGSIGSEFVIVSLGLTCMIDRCFDSRMQLNVQLLSEGPSRNSTARFVSCDDLKIDCHEIGVYCEW